MSCCDTLYCNRTVSTVGVQYRSGGMTSLWYDIVRTRTAPWCMVVSSEGADDEERSMLASARAPRIQNSIKKES